MGCPNIGSGQWDDPYSGAALIAAERQRQIDKERWTPDHDDRHNQGQLAAAAACYALPDIASDWWPWAGDEYKPKDQLQDLVRAGALIAAEIDRVRRLES